MPSKSWYITLDDDTYILNSSLKSTLGHLDPSVPYYIGNAVGDYRARFVHGGSAVIFSQAAMDSIFIQNPTVVAKGSSGVARRSLGGQTNCDHGN